MGFFRRVANVLSAPFRGTKKRQRPKTKPAPEVEAPETIEPIGSEAAELEDVLGTTVSAYRIVDYQDVNGVWRNTDPIGEITTDGSRTGQGDPPPSTADIESSDWVNVGFQDDDGEWYYRWIQGPFDEEFWIDDAIEQIAGEYGIAYGTGV